MNAKTAVKKGLPDHPEGLITMQSFSASKGDGISDLERQLVLWLKPPADELVEEPEQEQDLSPEADQA